jgi:hypothetical protein
VRIGRLNCRKRTQRTQRVESHSNAPHPASGHLLPSAEKGFPLAKRRGFLLRSLCLFAANKFPRSRRRGFVLRSVCSFADDKLKLQKVLRI